MRILASKDGNLYGSAELDQALDELVKGSGRFGFVIASEADWNWIKKLVDFWIKFYPKEYQKWLGMVGIQRESLLNKYGLMIDPQDRKQGTQDRTSSKGNDANVRHVLNLPPFIHAVLRKVYPAQKMDLNFSRRMISEFPMFGTGAKL